MGRNTELTSLKQLLTRFEALRPPQKTVIDTFQAAVTALCGVTPERSAIRYTVATRTIGLSGGGPLKSEIGLKRTEILAFCRDALGKHAPEQIV